MSDNLKKYVCLNPFRYLDIQPTSMWLCCPSWCPTNLRQDKNGDSIDYDKLWDQSEDLEKNWFSESAQKIRKSVTDGTYSYCDHKVCPSLAKLINTGMKPFGFISIEEFNKKYDVDNFKGLPEDILFGFDRSCNLKCPSCRATTIPNDDFDTAEHKSKEFILNQIEDKFSTSAENLMITGSGDPIYSKLYREYLENFDSGKYSNMKEIHLITNGVLLNEKMWDKLKAKPLIKRIEISIDAGTKDTYENVTRLNGNWDMLIENLKFLSTLEHIEFVTCSMVVSKYNYKEMEMFYKLIYDIFKESKFFLTINFRQHVFWHSGLYSIQDVNNIAVFERNHPNFEDFMLELDKIHNKPKVDHNFHHLYN